MRCADALCVDEGRVIADAVFIIGIPLNSSYTENSSSSAGRLSIPRDRAEAQSFIGSPRCACSRPVRPTMEPSRKMKLLIPTSPHTMEIRSLSSALRLSHEANDVITGFGSTGLARKCSTHQHSSNSAQSFRLGEISMNDSNPCFSQSSV